MITKNLARIDKSTKWILIIFVFTVTVHTILAWYDAFVAPLPEAELDSLSFHFAALSLVAGQEDLRFVPGSNFYKLFLAFFYEIGFSHKFFGNMVSVFASAAGLIFFVKCMDKLNITKWRPILLLVFAFDPAFILYGSITIREPFQLLFFLVGVYFLLHTFSSFTTSNRFWYTALFSLSIFLMGLFHLKGLFALSIIILFGASIFLMIYGRGGIGRSLIGFVPLLFIALLWVISGEDYTDRVLTYSGLESVNAIEAVSEYRKVITRTLPRTLYPTPLDISSVTNLIWTYAINFNYYLFYPYIWNVQIPSDLVPMLASSARIFSVFYILIHMRKIDSKAKSNFWILAILYILVTGLWSLGTTNYGQAFRHHLMSNWILIMGVGIALNYRKFRQRYEG